MSYLNPEVKYNYLNLTIKQNDSNKLNSFEALHEKISAETFNGELTKAEYAKMLVGCYVIVGNLQDRIVALQKAVAGYQTDIVPKLSKIIEADTEEAAQTLAKELLVISEN